VLIKQYGRRTLASFSPGEIRDVAQLLHPEAGNATRNRHGIAPFMAVYNHAVHRKLRRPLSSAVQKAKKSVSIDRLDRCRSHQMDGCGALVRLMYETGMRISTAIALLPGMPDAASNVVRVWRGSRTGRPQFLCHGRSGSGARRAAGGNLSSAQSVILLRP
jgi:hypothetical protein